MDESIGCCILSDSRGTQPWRDRHSVTEVITTGRLAKEKKSEGKNGEYWTDKGRKSRNEVGTVVFSGGLVRGCEFCVEKIVCLRVKCQDIVNSAMIHVGKIALHHGRPILC